MAIPEFILKKLIVPGSFKETDSGFRFTILNSFAPASISRFGLQVGDKAIPPENISIFVAGQLPVTGSALSPEDPMPLPVGVEITVESYSPAAGGAPVYVNAMTKEVGEINFCLSAGKKSAKPKEMKPLIFSVFHSINLSKSNLIR